MASCRVAGHGHAGRRTGQFPAPTHVKWILHLGKGELTVVEGESVSHERKALRGLLALKAREPRPAREEVFECAVEMSHCLLQRDAGDVIEPGVSRLLLEQSQRGRVVLVRGRLLVPVPLLAARQHVVRDKAHAAEVLRQHWLLSRCAATATG